MRVVLAGANGGVGWEVAPDMLGAGHASGLVRSKGTSEALAALGGTPLVETLADLGVLRGAAGEAVGVVRTAFGLDVSRTADPGEEDRRAIETMRLAARRSPRDVDASPSPLAGPAPSSSRPEPNTWR